MPASTSDDRVSAELAAIRERAELVQKPGIGLEVMLHSCVSAQDVPRLLAAVEAALAVHEPVPVYEIALHGHASGPIDGGFILHCGHPDAALDDDRHAESDEGDWICLDKLIRTACGGCRDDEGELADLADCATRAAIERALTGEDGSDRG